MKDIDKFKATSTETTGDVKPCTIMTIRLAPVRNFCVIDCNSGSMQTSPQTSVRRLAVRSRIFCLIEGKPPLGQERACSTGNWHHIHKLRWFVGVTSFT